MKTHESENVKKVFALTWRCDGSKGIKWMIRGIRSDGFFYVDILFQADPERRKAATVEGQLKSEECKWMLELIAVISIRPHVQNPEPHFGALFQRRSPSNAGDVIRLFEYRLGEEVDSEPARAFVELIGLFEEHLRPFYVKID